MSRVSGHFKDFPDVLNISQVSKLLQISEKTAYKLIKENRIRYIKIGRVYRVYKTELLRYISNAV